MSGANFVSGSTVLWNGAPLATVFVNASTLTATVPASDVAHASTASVSVSNLGDIELERLALHCRGTARDFRLEHSQCNAGGCPVHSDDQGDELRQGLRGSLGRGRSWAQLSLMAGRSGRPFPPLSWHRRVLPVSPLKILETSLRRQRSSQSSAADHRRLRESRPAASRRAVWPRSSCRSTSR